MKKLTNYTPGPRGVTLKSGEVVWIKPGATVEFKNEGDDEIVTKPDLGSKPAAEADADADALAAVQTENDDLKKQIAVLQADLEKATKPAK